MNLNLKFAIQGMTKIRDVIISLVNETGNVLLEKLVTVESTVNDLELIFESTPNENFYIQISGNGLIRTFSSDALTPSLSVSYDFTDDVSKTYGGNAIEITSGVFAVYNGDFNNDGVIDNSDVALHNNDVNFQSEISRFLDIAFA